ncbi:hypothetical protein JJJ17_02600 [Paracoccus caeni]|uniref:Uncharacterized protein n=1 Tax=Paracoccus caeni TaxID=657651 RepID=A0A934SCH2_9RHOB|nr:hypothetical protein [Paracoccus caeni]MBK4214810.1 hypothetical protein [Paracoccus caeni]
MKCVTAAILCLSMTPVWAEDLKPDEAAVLPRILSMVQVDLVEDRIGQERAVLLRGDGPNDDLADLVILTGEPDERLGEVLVVARNMVWAGMMAGQVPWLEVSERGSLLVKSEQIAAGRAAWEQTLTLAWRDGELRVAGFTINQWDRVNAGSSVCDWNLLSGNWTMSYEIPSDSGDGRKGESSGRQTAHIAASDWTVDPGLMADFCYVDLSE